MQPYLEMFPYVALFLESKNRPPIASRSTETGDRPLSLYLLSLSMNSSTRIVRHVKAAANVIRLIQQSMMFVRESS